MYAQFIRFLAPLILAMVAQGLSAQFLNGGMARVPQAIETLAAFGLAHGLITVMSCQVLCISPGNSVWR